MKKRYKRYIFYAKNRTKYVIIIEYERGFVMDIKVKSDYITLGQLLKVADFISSGGQAKFAVKELEITVNGEKENRRGRKLYPNDEVMIEGTLIHLL